MPHTYTAMEHLIMAMSDASNNRGKTSFFGHDKGLKSYLKLEEKLRNALLAMVMDGFISRFDSAKEFHEKLLLVIDAWEAIFPNTFAYEKLRASSADGRKLISALIGVKN
jgi:hypothetical protein